MCTYNISIEDTLVEQLRPAIGPEGDVSGWVQRQVELAVLRHVRQLRTHNERQDSMRRLLDFAAADPSTVTLADLEGLLPAPQTPIEDLRDAYVVDKYLNKELHFEKETRIAVLRNMARVLLKDYFVAGHDNESLLRGVDDMRFVDLEDSCQLQAAVSSGCQWLITFNLKDYPAEKQIEIMTPQQFLNSYP